MDIERCRDQNNGCTLQILRNIIVGNSFTDSGKNDNGDGISKSCTKAAYDALCHVVLVQYVFQCHTKHRTVGCDQRKINAQRPVKGRDKFFQEHFHYLNQRCDYQDKDNGLKIFQMEPHQDLIV